MNKLAGGIILTSQGISFFQAGEEFARSKGGDENSYKSPSSVNQLVWSNTKTYSDLLAYYKGLIEIRKAYSPFRCPTSAANNTMYFSWGDSCPSNVVAFTMYNTIAPDSEWNFVGVIHNSASYAQQVTLMSSKTLPSQWTIIADGSTAGLTSLGTTGSTVTVPARSTMVLVDKTSFDSTVISSGGKVTVNHVIKPAGTTYKTETLKGKEGASYTTSPLSELLNSGYKLDSTSGQTTGTFTKAGTTVTYYYTIDSTKFAQITVKYQDAETGKSIASDSVTSGEIGKTYSVSPISINGYECDPSLTNNATGTLTASGVTVIFKYNETAPSGLRVHYYNSAGWTNVGMYVYTGKDSTAVQLTGTWPGTKMTSEGSGWYVGDVNTTGSALFIANNFVAVNGEQDPSGLNPDGYSVTGEVWIKGGKVYPTGKVNVRYETQDGTLLEKLTLSGIADGTATYTTSSKTFDGYELVTTPTNATGLYTQAPITVTYVYKSKTTPVPDLVNSSKISPAKITLGSSATVTCSASGGTSPYTYAVYSKLSSATYYSTVRNYASGTSVKFTPSAAGTYNVRVYVKDSKGTTAIKSFNVNVTKGVVTNKSTVSATTTTLGKSITITGTAAGGTSPYQYASWYKHSTASSYTLNRNYSSTRTMTFKPAHSGKYTLLVRVKDNLGTVISKTITITVNPGPLTSTTKVSATSITLGNKVTITNSATGGKYGYKYAAYYKKSTSQYYTTLKDFTTTKTFYFKPASAGTWNLRTKVKDASGKIVTKNFNISVTAPLANKTTISTTKIVLGSSVKVTAKATGGKSPYKYAGYMKKSTATKYTEFRAASTTSTMYAKPTSVGTWNLRIKVKDASGKVLSKDFKVTVTAALANKSTLSAASILLGKSVMLNCAATGGTAPYQYAASYKNVTTGSAYKLLRGYSTYNKMAFKPTTAGTYTVLIKVKDKAGKVVVKTITLKVTKPAALTNKSTINKTSISFGSSVTVKCAASGGKAGYTYEIGYKKTSKDTYSIVQSFSSDTSIQITPGARTTYDIRVRVKDKAGTVKSKFFTLTVK